MELYLTLAIPILITTAWLYTAQMTKSRFPTIRNKRICLLIAHPDDEAMFFSPTLTALTAPELGNHLKILCLSSGDADGLGEIRKKELVASASKLGLRSESDVLVLEDPRFPDSMTTSWPSDAIVKVLSSAFSPPPNNTKKSNSGSSSSEAPTASIDVILTFDKHGISSHPNHISLYYGAHSWLSKIMMGKGGWRCPVELYTLTSTNIIRKYASFFDAPVTLFLAALNAKGTAKQRREQPPSLLFVSGFSEYRRGQDAMVSGHKSQMRWFRWGWIGVGRYMIVNDLKREIVKT